MDGRWGHGIAKLIRSHQNEIKYCYETELNKNPSLAGKVAVAFTIDPEALETSSKTSGGVVQVRRYRCQACGGTCTVAPWEVAWRRLYSVAAMAWALALWGLVGMGMEAVRRLVNPWNHTGASEAGCWRTPLRWLRAVHQGQLLAQGHALRPWPPHWRPRQAAAHVASVVAGYAPPAAPSPPLSVLAFQGAARAQ